MPRRWLRIARRFPSSSVMGLPQGLEVPFHVRPFQTVAAEFRPSKEFFTEDQGRETPEDMTAGVLFLRLKTGQVGKLAMFWERICGHGADRGLVLTIFNQPFLPEVHCARCHSITAGTCGHRCTLNSCSLPCYSPVAPHRSDQACVWPFPDCTRLHRNMD